jgi:hypothetical protein
MTQFIRKSYLFLTLSVISVAFAQETTGGIQGVVKDSSGGMVANVTIELSGPALIGIRKVQTESSGAYRITQLPPGEYSITATAPGFRTYRQNGVAVAVGRLPNIDIDLQVGAIAESIEVAASTPLVDVTQSKVAVEVSKQTINDLPKSRSFQSLIGLARGARMEPLQGGRNNRNDSFQVDGASDSENVYMVDGVNMTDAQGGGVGKNFQIDFIEAVQIKSTGIEAEYGGAIGGVVNAVPKRGSNQWHGALLTYLQLNGLNAVDPCLSGMTAGYNGPNFTGPTAANVNVLAQSQVCGLRLNPTRAGLNNALRLDGTPEYYLPKKDQRSIVEPGYEISGPLLANKVWLYSSYVPTLDTIHRTVSFTAANPGARTLTSSFVQHNMYNRLDYGPINTLRLFAAWNYSYGRQTGQLVLPDSAAGQVNTQSTTDPNTLRSDAGFVYPSSVYSFGGDWTPTSRLVVTGRYGYFFSNVEQRGVPQGIRYVYQASVNANTKDLAGAAFPASSFNTTGFANISSNLARIFDAFKRKSFNIDASYFANGLGTHTFKVGYFQQSQYNDVLNGYQGAVVDLWWSQSYQPLTSATACDAIKTQNSAQYGAAAGQNCQGLYGYFQVGGQAVTNTGATTQYAHEFYVQDAWQVFRGLTLNVGVRFNQESLPAYDPARFPNLEFGFGKKIAPRIGGAYDLLHNGKVKVFASYGQFYDTMKMGLARGSFGSDYWHQCVYALDTTNFNSILPSDFSGNGGCPVSGPAPGVNARFIENLDLRATKADPRDPGIDTHMNPMKQHEMTVGVDLAVSTNWGFESRYSRKRLDNAIEDMSITDSLGYYIGNPGSAYADILRRPVSIPCVKTPGFSCTPDAGGNYYNTTPFCAECPPAVRADRRYDGMELRFFKRPTGKWFVQISYTYSKLRGNYSGLVNTDPTDASGGRHSPNNGRAFDIPTMTYLPSGKIDDGPLSSDRPHTATIFASYPVKWAHMTTNFGMSETLYQGTPMATCLPSIGTSSACQWAEGRGNFAELSRAANGNFELSNVNRGARTDPFIQTDLSVRHEIPVKAHEGMRLTFEAQASNLFNQHAKLAFYQFAIPSNTLAPSRAPRFAGDPAYDWGKLMNGFNYVDALNGTGTFAGVQAPLTAASRYGMPQLFQAARTMRLQVRFTF